MILPEDTKAPLSDDEDYLDYDDDGVDVEAGYPYRYSASDLETDAFIPFHPHPHHPHSRSNAYPPPYTPTALPAEEKPYTLRDRLRRRFDEIAQSRGRLMLVAFVLAIFYSLTLSGRYHGRHGHGPHRGEHGGLRPPRPPPEFWRNNDGQAVNCAAFTSLPPPAVAPASDATVNETEASVPPIAAVEGTTPAVRSVNATFALPLTAHEIFASLRTPTVRNVYVTSYDPADIPTPADSLITLEGESDGPRVMVTVEAVYHADTSSNEEVSPGTEALAGTRVCLMVRNSTHPHHKDGPRRHGKHQRTLGVGIYPPGKLAKRSGSDATSPLEFNVHIALPFQNGTAPEPHARRSVVDAIMSAFSSHPQPPAFAVPPLSIRSGEAAVHIANLTGVAVSGLKVDATVGDVTVDHVRAESVQLHSVGNIKADVAVSHSVDVTSPAGAIDLTVGTIRTPAFRFYRDHDDDRRPPPRFANLKVNSTDAECFLPPVAINVHANNNNAVLRHSEWEVPCRPVSEHVRSMVGSIDVYPHALFEGSVRLVTTVGAISVQNSGIEDPTGAGRHRKVDLVKTSRHGAKEYNGEVHWVYADATASDIDDTITQENEEEEKTTEGKLARRSVLEYDLDERDEADAPASEGGEPRRGHGHGASLDPRPPGLTIETSVGSVNVVF